MDQPVNSLLWCVVECTSYIDGSTSHLANVQPVLIAKTSIFWTLLCPQYRGFSNMRSNEFAVIYYSVPGDIFWMTVCQREVLCLVKKVHCS